MITGLLLLTLVQAPGELRALGVVISADPERRSAVISDGERTRVIRLGEPAFGGRLSGVETDRVRLDFDGRVVELRVASPSIAGPPVEPAPADAILSRADLQRRLATDATRILSETTLIPVAEDGQITGFALTRLPRDTVLDAAGLQPGDVLRSINGVRIDSLATLAGLYSRLQGEGTIQAELLRDGQPVSITLRLGE